jgi:hypothetical protein
MSLSTGLIAIKGQHSDKFAEIFNFFKLVDTNNDRTLTNWDEAIQVIDDEYMNREDNSQRRIVWFDNGWTLIEDLSLILCTDEESLTKISQHFSTQVFSLATQGTGDCYGFWYFDKQKLRSFFNTNGEVTDNFGTPLSQEANFNINENAFYDDIHGVAKQFGIDLANAENLNSFIVKQLDNSEELNIEIAQATKNHNQFDNNSKSKPWWKFW